MFVSPISPLVSDGFYLVTQAPGVDIGLIKW